MLVLSSLISFWLAAAAVAQEKGPEKDWNAMVAAAKKEGVVAVMSSAGGSEPRKALSDEFTKRYGIDVEYNSASGSSMVSRIKTERAAGQYIDRKSVV